MNQWLFLGAEAVRGQVPAVARQVEEIVPGARQAAEAWLPGKSAAKGDVPGGPGGHPPYEGFVRTRYAAAGERSVTYEGRGDFRAVADHYTGRLSEKGWAHRILYADEEERHTYRSGRARLELSVRDAGGQDPGDAARVAPDRRFVPRREDGTLEISKGRGPPLSLWV